MEYHNDMCTVLGTKSLIGCQCYNEEMQNFLVESYSNNFNKAKKIFQWENTETPYITPINIYTAILSKIRDDIKKNFENVKNIKAVVTVPAHFNIDQRENTLKAAQKAGFQVLELLNESTAISICCSNQLKTLNNDDNVLIYDLGGGTFDAAIFKKIDNNFEPVAVSADNGLGGQNFDNLIFNYISRIFQEKNINIGVEKRMQLQIISEKAKKMLSTLTEYQIPLQNLVSRDEINNIKISRNEFEDMASGLFARTVNIIDRFLCDNNLSKWDIKKVILCGGCANIPKIQQLLSNYFDRNISNSFICPSNVARGAALQAGQLISNLKQPNRLTLLSIGMRGLSNSMNVIINKNTSIPCSQTISFSAAEIKRYGSKIDIYEGENSNCAANRHLTTVKLDQIATNLDCDQSLIVIRVAIDTNGGLTVFANQKIKANTLKLKTIYKKPKISEKTYNSPYNINDRKVRRSYINFDEERRKLLNCCQNVMYYIRTNNLFDKLKNIYVFCQAAYLEADKMKSSDKDDLIMLCQKTKQTCYVLEEILIRNSLN